MLTVRPLQAIDCMGLFIAGDCYGAQLYPVLGIKELLYSDTKTDTKPLPIDPG